MPRWQRVVVFLIAATVTSLFYINFCNAIFNCGCTWLWAGADAHCNVHTGPKRCPWCANGVVVQYGIWAVMVTGQAIIAFKTKMTLVPRLTVAILAFPVIGIVLALGAGIRQGYWD